MYSIGIDVGGTNLQAGLIDDQLRIAAVEKMPMRWAGEEKFVHDLLSLAEALISGAGRPGWAQVEFIGIGIPGQVDNGSGVAVHAVNVPIRNLPLADMIRHSWDTPVFLGNDADCAALGEFYCFSDRSIRDLILVTLGTGVGTGLIMDGKIRRGVNGCAGEGGHMVIAADGEPCTCGRRGCWEQYASASALIRMTRRAMEVHRESAMWLAAEGALERVDGRTAFTAAKQGDAAGKAVVDRYIDYLAVGVANLVNLLQPEVICLGGGISHEDDEWLLHPLQRKVELLRYDQNTSAHTIISKAKLGNDAGMIGAACLGRR